MLDIFKEYTLILNDDFGPGLVPDRFSFRNIYEIKSFSSSPTMASNKITKGKTKGIYNPKVDKKMIIAGYTLILNDDFGPGLVPGRFCFRNSYGINVYLHFPHL